ncbi:MAG: hypothetical protein PVG65_03310 [Candidatus Thorarchaeota archaeon]|jgi:hypothetical protein
MDIQSVIDTIVAFMTKTFNYIFTHPQYIIIVFVIIIIYAVAHYLIFKTKGYQPQDKMICELTLLGKERSLDYLKTFTHMESDQLAIISYLRKQGTASVSALTKKYGKGPVQTLIRNGYIILK